MSSRSAAEHRWRTEPWSDVRRAGRTCSTSSRRGNGRRLSSGADRSRIGEPTSCIVVGDAPEQARHAGAQANDVERRDVPVGRRGVLGRSTPAASPRRPGAIRRPESRPHSASNRAVGRGRWRPRPTSCQLRSADRSRSEHRRQPRTSDTPSEPDTRPRTGRARHSRLFGAAGPSVEACRDLDKIGQCHQLLPFGRRAKTRFVNAGNTRHITFPLSAL